MKFRLKVKDDQGNKIGDHYVGDERYVGGQVIESKKPLDKIFRGKFERVDDEVPASVPEIVKVNPHGDVESVETSESVVPEEEEKQETTSEEVKPPKKIKTKKGLDVTDEFAGASLHGVKVFLEPSTGLYKIMDGESEAILKKAKDELSVKKYIKSLA